ncbi:hypothetical protein Hanom_Chr17g01592001 [Helianthus anomalus]
MWFNHNRIKRGRNGTKLHDRHGTTRRWSWERIIWIRAHGSAGPVRLFSRDSS